MKKRWIAVLPALVVSLMVLAGCAGISDGGDDPFGDANGTYTGSGYEYRAYVYDGEDSASVQYLDASLDIESGEFVLDDFDDQKYLVLHMFFQNDTWTNRPEGDENTTFYMDSLNKAFVIQAIQDGKVIEHRSEAEATSFEESNCWEEIDSGESLECEMYFPIDSDSPVTVQVLNPDGEDTVMAELTYTPGDSWGDVF